MSRTLLKVAGEQNNPSRTKVLPHDFADKPQTDRKNRLLKTCFSIERTEKHSLQGKVI